MLIKICSVEALNRPTSPMAKTQDKLLADILFPKRDTSDTDSILNIPPEQRRLITDSYDFTVSSLVDSMEKGRIVVPEYQRRVVWKKKQQSRLIESLIIQCPIPIVYLNQEPNEVLSVIDGNQRLNALKAYLKNEFPLVGLRAYPELDGLRFHELDPRFQRHIENRTIRCLVIMKETHPQVKFDVFERLNTGSVELNAQELRHGLHYGDMITLAETLAKDETFMRLLNVKENKRMKVEELVLRFFAFLYRADEYRKPLSHFLNVFCDEHRKLSTDRKTEFETTFRSAVAAVDAMYGNLAFKVIDQDQKVLSVFNAALYDAEFVSAALLLRSGKPLPARAAVLGAVSDLLKDNDDFKKAVGQATSDERQVKTRIEILNTALVKI